MDPEIPPFELDYVTTEQKMFIKIQGDRYINRSVPLRSSVNMSCFYEGKQLFKECFHFDRLLKNFTQYKGTHKYSNLLF